MKTDNKEEAERLMDLEMPEKTTIKIDVLRIVIDMILNEQITYGKACEMLTVLALNENNQLRFHPETFEEVKKPEDYDDYTNGNRGALLLVTNTFRQELIKEYNNALTFDQLIERCKEMRESYSRKESFWRRLSNFVHDIEVSDMMGQEEKDMILIQCKNELDLLTNYKEK